MNFNETPPTSRHRTDGAKEMMNDSGLYNRHESQRHSPGNGVEYYNNYEHHLPATMLSRPNRRLPPSPEWSPAPSTDSVGSDLVHNNVQQQPSYVGYIKSPVDAVLLLAACDMPCSPSNERKSQIPRRITRRLLDDERASLIRSGSIFVWDEHEASMRRWTDGRCWSASRVSGCFLTYRELEMRKKSSSDSAKDGPLQNLYKADGLIKQSFSITTASNRKLHVISYYRKQDVRMGLLQRVSEDPRITGNGPGSWGIHVDEKEFGELLNREEETLPESVSVSRSGELPPTPAGSEGRGVKRSNAELDNEERPAKIHSLPPVLPRGRPLLPSHYEREHDNYLAYPTPYIPGEDYAMRSHRYERNGPHMYHPAPNYGQPIAPCDPYARPSNAPSTAMPLHSAPSNYSKTLLPQTHLTRLPYAPRTNQPIPYSPRHSDMEQDSIEALISLRSHPTHGHVYHQPAVPLLSRDVMGTNPSRTRPAPVSAPDRDALQKLGVRV